MKEKGDLNVNLTKGSEGVSIYTGSLSQDHLHSLSLNIVKVWTETFVRYLMRYRRGQGVEVPSILPRTS